MLSAEVEINSLHISILPVSLKDDNTFVFVDNLKAFLKTKNPDDYFSYGYNFIVNGGYHSGGPGYVIGNRAMKLIGRELDENDTKSCPSTGIEDVDVARCLRVCLFVNFRFDSN